MAAKEDGRLIGVAAHRRLTVSLNNTIHQQLILCTFPHVSKLRRMVFISIPGPVIL